MGHESASMAPTITHGYAYRIMTYSPYREDMTFLSDETRWIAL